MKKYNTFYARLTLAIACIICLVGCGSVEDNQNDNLAETTITNNLFSQESLYGTWRIDRAVLWSEMYTGTTLDGDLEENLYDPEDFMGYELEYSEDLFRLGTEEYIEPIYSVEKETIDDVNSGGGFKTTNIYKLIREEEIKVCNEEMSEKLSKVEVPVFQVDFAYEATYEGYSFVPMGTQVVLLNEDTMLVGLWGEIMIAHKIDEPIDYEKLKANHAILEYSICVNPQSVYESEVLCEHLKEDLEFEAEFSETFNSKPATIVYFTFDFNDDGEQDYFVCFSGAAWSGTAGDSIRIYIQEKGKLRQVFRISARVFEPSFDSGYAPVAILTEKTNEFYDFVLPWTSNRICKYNVGKGIYE